MLKGVKSEGGDGGGVRMSEDAEHAALFAQPIGVRIEIREIQIPVQIGVGGRLIHRAALRRVHWPSSLARLSAPTH
jgi:hypothetical protein